MGHEHINCEAHAHDHIHSHTHEHTHDGHTHTHPHDHEHSHDHVHPHTHDHLHEHGHEHHHDHDHHDHAAAPLQQLAALMNYMVDHNAAHANELADLAQQLKTAGKEDAYALVMSAVTDFNKGNETLAKVLKSLAD